MASYMRYVKWPKLKVKLDTVNNTLVIDGISKTSMQKAKSSLTITESLVDPSDPEGVLFSPYKYVTIEIDGKLLLKLYKKLAKYYGKKDSEGDDPTDEYWREMA